MNLDALKIFFLYLFLFFPLCKSYSYEEKDSAQSSKIHHQIEFNASSSYIFQTDKFFKGENNRHRELDRTTSYHLKYGFRFSDDSYWGRLYPHTYQGIGVSYNDFYDIEEIGRPVSVYVYQGSPIAWLSPYLSLDYEWNFGVSFGWKPYDSETNSNNVVIGSRVNAYMNLGLNLNWQLTDNIKLKCGADVSHFSNGNTQYPNRGVNLISLRSGLTYCFDSSVSKNYSTTIIQPFKPYWSFDALIYGASRIKGIISENYLVPGKFGIVGFNFSPLYCFNRYLKSGVSLDGVYDESANLENNMKEKDNDGNIYFKKQPFSQRFCIGLSARGEFVMPVFSINFGIGHDIFYNGDYSRGLYQVLSLKTSITRKAFINVGYQLSKFHIPKNLMLGVGYRFQ